MQDCRFISILALLADRMLAVPAPGFLVVPSVAHVAMAVLIGSFTLKASPVGTISVREEGKVMCECCCGR
ncbi:MAG: hypothetical protein QN181_11495 [Armatimonadota bacterium]|nr:hypothetical protein [Armatimonadota bacterium]